MGRSLCFVLPTFIPHSDLILQGVSKPSCNLRSRRSTTSHILPSVHLLVLFSQVHPRDKRHDDGASTSCEQYKKGNEIARSTDIKVTGPNVWSIADCLRLQVSVKYKVSQTDHLLTLIRAIAEARLTFG